MNMVKDKDLGVSLYVCACVYIFSHLHGAWYAKFQLNPQNAIKQWTLLFITTPFKKFRI